MSHTFAARRLANRQRRNEAREQILEVARRELKVRPFRELSVDELMQATGLSRTAFYRYFPDREAVLVDLLQEVWGEFAEARDADPDLTQADSLPGLARLIADNRAVLKAVADAAPGDEEVERAYRAFMHDYWIGDLTSRIADAQSRGLAAGLDPQVAGEALGWMAERLVTQSLEREPRQVLDTLVAIFAKCLYDGPPPGPSSEPSGPSSEPSGPSSEPSGPSGPSGPPPGRSSRSRQRSATKGSAAKPSAPGRPRKKSPGTES